MADKPMLVVQDENGAQYAMTEAAYEADFAEQGYTVVGYEDGTPYEGDAKMAKPPEPAQLPAEPDEPKRGRRAAKE